VSTFRRTFTRKSRPRCSVCRDLCLPGDLNPLGICSYCILAAAGLVRRTL
jgi:hypothetical protein